MLRVSTLQKFNPKSVFAFKSIPKRKSPSHTCKFSTQATFVPRHKINIKPSSASSSSTNVWLKRDKQSSFGSTPNSTPILESIDTVPVNSFIPTTFHAKLGQTEIRSNEVSKSNNSIKWTSAKESLNPTSQPNFVPRSQTPPSSNSVRSSVKTICNAVAHSETGTVIEVTSLQQSNPSVVASEIHATSKHQLLPLSPQELNDMNTLQDTPKVNSFLDRVHMVTNIKEAQRVVARLKSYGDSVTWACDTEVADIDLKNVGPVGNGRVVCFSVYGGPDVDFGSGPDKALWVENLGKSEGVLEEFRSFFEDEGLKKAWHNYGFDRHVIYNHGIDCRGFIGDTMHMARLWDTSRDKISGGDGYSLEELSKELVTQSIFEKVSMKDIFGVPKLKKNGEESKIKVIPDVVELQLNATYREKWIEYSAKDAIATWYLRQELQHKLEQMTWTVDGKRLGHMYDFYSKYFAAFGEVLTSMERNGIKVDTKTHLRLAEQRAREERDKKEKMFLDWASKECPDAYSLNTASTLHMQHFFFGKYVKKQFISEENTKIFEIDKTEEEYARDAAAALAINKYVNHTIEDMKIELKARNLKCSGKKTDLMSRLLMSDRDEERARKLESEYASAKHIQPQFPSVSVIDKEFASAPVSAGINDFAADENTTSQISTDEQNPGAKVKKAKASKLTPFDLHNQLLVDRYGYSTEQVAALRLDDEKHIQETIESTPALKRQREITVKTLAITPEDFTPSGMPQVTAAVLRKLAGKNLFDDEKEAVWGTAFEFFGQNENAKQACRAIGALADVGQIDATITNFLVPLQALVDKNSRIHCSLNLNTETGRLSSRRPNLQNQPALEKDPYKIRDAFIAEPGKTLIVADYGQLELRILAHITNCASMLSAFESGGCFHSRTAVGMYDYIQESIDRGEVLLEWDYSKGTKPPVPLVKDKFGAERRKAKTLNFSIAYGKTVHGLAEDWGIEKEEAQQTLEAWYRDRPEVKEWQEKTKKMAEEDGKVFTVMGRHRNLFDAMNYRTGQEVPLKIELDQLRRKLSSFDLNDTSEEKLKTEMRLASVEQRLKETHESRRRKDHALRAAINTPIQGSAADIVMMAMIKLAHSKILESLGWRLLLQIHDEVILEGPVESRDEAMAEVVQCMEYPYDSFGLNPLRVHLAVDAKSADSWYKAK